MALSECFSAEAGLLSPATCATMECEERAEAEDTCGTRPGLPTYELARREDSVSKDTKPCLEFLVSCRTAQSSGACGRASSEGW
jgi:hypothetical protein